MKKLIDEYDYITSYIQLLNQYSDDSLIVYEILGFLLILSYDYNKLPIFFSEQMINIYFFYLGSEKQEIVISSLCLIINLLVDIDSQNIGKLFANKKLYETIFSFLVLPPKNNI